MSNAQNGARIKAWAGPDVGSGIVRNITFQNFLESEVDNPVVIDQVSFRPHILFSLSSREEENHAYLNPQCYFTDEDGHDMRVAVAGIRRAREIVAQGAMDAFRGRELFPGEDVQTDEEIADYVSRTHNTVYHPAGTVRMGAVDDPDSPLDPQLRVKGVQGLRVVDGSVMPQLVAVNPNITTMLIGERAADLLRADLDA